ncbi:cell wall metabolism sensor histidine kinase WalK [Candidatus Aquiluna sp. UB-MaderosW2red]|uniref:sensor histidine kinase n=1 Tax=Candidatus Aquiluna sp. UB-MaderosW2red TaxID=1855377 RepID=UPI000875D2C4|nr:HAMP domain-containing sensor histidine kinase [Candidatus Aquiluna sp. UB-MaderosW2red]SCX08475.1 two-component system, OmpR family, sensor kinase [Candidatus Aquiluna sp. UB-MaderosW2red]
MLAIWERISLRSKLTALAVSLIGLLLTVSSAGTVALLSTYLQQTTDALLLSTANSLRSENPLQLEQRVSSGDLALPSLPSDYYIAILDAEGNQFLGLVSASGGGRTVPNFSFLALDAVVETEATPFDVEVQVEGGLDSHWRMVAIPLTRANGSVVVALPTSSNRQIIAQYGVIGARFGIFLLVVSGLSIWLTINSALRPLKEVERTASAVKAGKFNSRLVERHGKTEIGRLNGALNSMLDSIESAVSGKDKTLNQMRRFVSDASHELRTPLVTVRGYAELYRMGAIKKPKDVAEAMQRIESEAIRMSGLVESLLTLTRLDELGSLNKERHELVVLAKQVVKDASVANPDVKFAFETNEQLIEIQIDADRIKQVLTNLVANAARFAPKNSEVAIRLSASKDKVLVQVIDHGEGIPEPLREKIFDRFYRVDNSRNRDTGGSGLGLAIASAIVMNHQGKIWVSETPGGGATFNFELPSTASITKA